MLSLSTAFVVLSTALLFLSQASATPREPIWRRACAIPTWTVKDLKIAISNDTYVPGNATFTLANSLTNKTESLRCEVPFNYFGLIDGTPGNKDLRIALQFNIDTATVTFNQTWACSNQTTNSNPSWVVGFTEFALKCPEPATDDEVCAADTLVVSGQLVTEPIESGGYP